MPSSAGMKKVQNETKTQTRPGYKQFYGLYKLRKLYILDKGIWILILHLIIRQWIDAQHLKRKAQIHRDPFFSEYIEGYLFNVS